MTDFAKSLRVLSTACLLALGAGGCARTDSEPVDNAWLWTADQPNEFLLFMVQYPDLLDTRYAETYYAAIDPLNERDTFEKWKSKNGFDAGFDAHIVFQDVRDLGYGRNMFMRKNGDGSIAVHVGNYQVSVLPGEQYGQLNLDAAVANEARWHIGTNAIEYSRVNPAGPADDVTNPFIAKYFTFTPDGQRLLAVDLDGRGAKVMPQPCISCHGGRADPLVQTVTGFKFPRGGDVKGRLHPLEVDALRFSGQAGFTRAEQETAAKTINMAVLCTYPKPAPTAFPEDTCRPTAQAGEWQGTAAELIKAWYGGDGLPSASFKDEFVPAGWQHDPLDNDPPADAPTLYRKVVAQNCRACHALRGASNQSDIDFMTYAKFMGYTDRHEHLIYNRGKMPLSLITYNMFWEGGSPGTAQLLASYLPGFAALDASGNVLKPGRPIANAGPDRTATSPVTLSASASLFATSYRWTIVSPAGGGGATLTNTTSAQPTLTAPDGVYVLELVVSNAQGDSAPAQLTVTINSAMSPAPTALTFTTHIKPILQGTCITCHEHTGLVPGVPMAYTDFDRDGDGLVDATDAHQLYREVMARVNLTDPEDSPLLRKPSNHHHNGLLQVGFDLAPAGVRTNYDTILNWILNGAPE